jgi:protein gp37
MQKSKIEWTDFTINPVKGLCPMACSYCYARRMYLNPFYKSMYGNQTIRFDQCELDGPAKIKKPSKFFVGSTMELFGDWVKPWWMAKIFKMVEDNPKHTFIFLTKQPHNLIKWSPFPDNCWVGVSLTGKEQNGFAYPLVHIKAKIKFLSIEPLLAPLKIGNNGFTNSLENASIGWLIIGQQTPVKMSTMPKVGWIEEIVSAADKANIPVFLKDNLISCVDQYPIAIDKNGNYRQEFPVLK